MAVNMCVRWGRDVVLNLGADDVLPQPGCQVMMLSSSRVDNPCPMGLQHILAVVAGASGTGCLSQE